MRKLTPCPGSEANELVGGLYVSGGLYARVLASPQFMSRVSSFVAKPHINCMGERKTGETGV